MPISVNKNVCIGCGACASICPNTFQIGTDGKAEVISESDTECARNAKESCPVQAITAE